MSKSLGNSPDALQLIEDFGADGVRFGMMLCSPAGGDLLFDEKLCEQGRNFCNKIWNALRLVDGWQTDENIKASSSDMLAHEWMHHKMNAMLADVDKNFNEYRLSEALMSIYNFVWNDFCSWYLEMVKPPYEGKIAQETKNNTIQLFTKICAIMHPFMPFITEEVWHKLSDRKEGDDCMISAYPASGNFDQQLIDKVEQAKDIITSIRDIRNKQGIKAKDLLDVYIISSDRSRNLINTAGWADICIKSASLNHLALTEDDSITGISFITGTEKCIVSLKQEIDIQSQIEEKKKELEYQLGFVTSVQKKLENERFVSGAPKDVVDKERAKLADGQERIRILEEEIQRLTGL
jgi:valyl-tRNA synthetase